MEELLSDTLINSIINNSESTPFYIKDTTTNWWFIISTIVAIISTFFFLKEKFVGSKIKAKIVHFSSSNNSIYKLNGVKSSTIDNAQLYLLGLSLQVTKKPFIFNDINVSVKFKDEKEWKKGSFIYVNYNIAGNFRKQFIYDIELDECLPYNTIINENTTAIRYALIRVETTRKDDADFYKFSFQTKRGIKEIMIDKVDKAQCFNNIIEEEKNEDLPLES